MLALRSILFAAMIPGTITLVIPYFILHGGTSPSPGQWALLRYFGILLFAPGSAILLRCIWDFAVSGRGTLAPVDPPRHLVVRGLYRYTRNPMYVGVFSMLLGEALFFWSRGLFLYSGIFFAVVNTVVFFYEEPTLRRQFGNSYDVYRRQVNRWWPTPPRTNKKVKVTPSAARVLKKCDEQVENPLELG